MDAHTRPTSIPSRRRIIIRHLFRKVAALPLLRSVPAEGWGRRERKKKKRERARSSGEVSFNSKRSKVSEVEWSFSLPRVMRDKWLRGGEGDGEGERERGRVENLKRKAGAHDERTNERTNIGIKTYICCRSLRFKSSRVTRNPTHLRRKQTGTRDTKCRRINI